MLRRPTRRPTVVLTRTWRVFGPHLEVSDDQNDLSTSHDSGNSAAAIGRLRRLTSAMKMAEGGTADAGAQGEPPSHLPVSAPPIASWAKWPPIEAVGAKMALAKTIDAQDATTAGVSA